MTEATAPARMRHPVEWALIIGLPIIFNVALAAYLLSTVESGAVPILGELDAPPVIGSPGDALPEASRDEIIASVEESTGSEYPCDGPWRASGGVRIWGCRTDAAVAVVHGLGAEGIFLLDVTWFGFDESASELPAWASAAFASEADAQRAADWVADNVGRHEETVIAGVSLVVDGAEGARTLFVEVGE